MGVTVHHGDSREVLKGFADASIDSVVCDPPYALVSIGKRFGAENAAAAKQGKTGAYARAPAGFMGQKWDTGETAFDPEFWVEVLRVLKPGGHLLAFSGTRTYHRLACAVEDAGFEIRDMVSWLYGSGFPKSHNVSKSIDRQNGDERPVVGSKKKLQSYGANEVFGSGPDKGGVQILTSAASAASAAWEGWGTALKPACEPIVLARKPLKGTVAANVLAHGTGALNIDASRIGYDPNDTNPATNPLHRKHAGYANGNAADTNSSSFSLKDGSGERNPNSGGRWPANVIHDGSDEVISAFPPSDGGGSIHKRSSPKTSGVYGAFAGDDDRWAGYADTGSAARFFYSSKADAADRCGSKHPTVKPIDLMAYLCRLVTPPGGVVLDPFAGSGSTGMACLREGFNCILIEREAQYVEDINHRLKHVEGSDTPLFSTDAAPQLFGDAA